MHPSSRYLLLRYWEGVDRGVLTYEARAHLRLPGLTNPGTCDAILDEILQHARQKRSVRLAASGGKKVKEPTAKTPLRAVPQWFDGRAIKDLSDDEYVSRFKLDEYVGTKSRQTKLYNAVNLWVNDGTRELLRGLLLSGKDDKEVSELVGQRFPKALSDKLRAVDVTAFRELFWDFSGMSISERALYVGQQGVNPTEISAVTSGADAFLFRIGLRNLDMDELLMFKAARDVAYLRIDAMRQSISAFDSRDFGIAYTTMKDAIVQVRDILADRSAGEGEMVASLQLQETEDFQSYADILHDAEVAVEMQMVEDVHRLGGLDESAYRTLLERIDSGQPLTPESRMMLLQFRDEQLRTAEVEKFGNADLFVEEPARTSSDNKEMDFNLGNLLHKSS